MSLPYYTVIRPARPRRRRRAAEWLYRNIAGLLSFVGALMAMFALEYGAGLHLGWWQVLFWAGLGVVWSGVRAS